MLYLQAGAIGKAFILLLQPLESDLIRLQLVLVAGGLVHQDLALLGADRFLKLPLPLGGLVAGVMHTVKGDTLLIVLPEFLQLGFCVAAMETNC